MSSKHVIQFEEVEGELDAIMTKMASEFAKVDPAKTVGETVIEQSVEFSAPYANKFVEYLKSLECEFEESIVRDEFSAIIDEFDTVDRAVYAKVEEQEPTQGIAVLVAEHKSKIMTHLQQMDEGYRG